MLNLVREIRLNYSELCRARTKFSWGIALQKISSIGKANSDSANQRFFAKNRKQSRGSKNCVQKSVWSLTLYPRGHKKNNNMLYQISNEPLPFGRWSMSPIFLS